ncbi:hypothetical protein MLD38_012805 [Melastoma candidum]|uniref:Uncharacterized protein n=1 Tax=Melastoma candidum TaxID=119954 RepID=A0ACB9R9B6_9MYRT|nr:hypothetical protein MLD38_012805 [Melastoma candidum]
MGVAAGSRTEESPAPSLSSLPSSIHLEGLHGGAIAALAERVSTACARTVVDGDLFLGELGMSYLSSATQNVWIMFTFLSLQNGGILSYVYSQTELTVEGSMTVKNITMVVVDFKIRDTGKLVYNTSAAKL